MELMFDAYNKNKDGKLDKAELQALFTDHGEDQASVEAYVWGRDAGA